MGPRGCLLNRLVTSSDLTNTLPPALTTPIGKWYFTKFNDKLTILLIYTLGR